MNSIKQKKKVDYLALNSSFMKVPHMKVEVARALMDLGFCEVYELSGRSSQTLLQDILRTKPGFPKGYLSYISLLVYMAETPEPDLKKLHPSFWQ